MSEKQTMVFKKVVSSQLRDGETGAYWVWIGNEKIGYVIHKPVPKGDKVFLQGFNWQSFEDYGWNGKHGNERCGSLKLVQVGTTRMEVTKALVDLVQTKKDIRAGKKACHHAKDCTYKSKVACERCLDGRKLEG